MVHAEAFQHCIESLFRIPFEEFGNMALVDFQISGRGGPVYRGIEIRINVVDNPVVSIPCPVFWIRGIVFKFLLQGQE